MIVARIERAPWADSPGDYKTARPWVARAWFGSKVPEVDSTKRAILTVTARTWAEAKLAITAAANAIEYHGHDGPPNKVDFIVERP